MFSLQPKPILHTEHILFSPPLGGGRGTFFMGEINTRVWPSRLMEPQIWDSKIWDSNPRKTALERPHSATVQK
jgi:hypothetical protein